MGKRIVIALGGNALGNNLPEQMAAVKQTAKAIADLIQEGHQVVIAHGNGVTTLYAHMQRGSRTVKEGDAVSQGQVIGLVGTTGSSTGNHLHFELRVNGVRNDVLRLYPGMTFTSPSGGKMSGG